MDALLQRQVRAIFFFLPHFHTLPARMYGEGYDGGALAMMAQGRAGFDEGSSISGGDDCFDYFWVISPRFLETNRPSDDSGCGWRHVHSSTFVVRCLKGAETL